MALHRRRILWPDCEDENEVPCIPSSPPVLAAAPPVISSATLPNAVVDSQVTTPSYGILMPIGRRRLLVVGVSLFAFVTILLAYYVAFRWYYHRRRRHRARTATAALPPPPPRSESNGDLQQDLLAGAGEVEPYHVWYIRTAGLDEPTIGAISVCAYRRGEGLVEGTDCSICLGEFLDGEMLRLLPKCSHAFHIPCIDTWLRSRVNCPLCRAPIVAPPAAIPRAAATAGELNSSSFRAATSATDVRSLAAVGDDDDDGDEPGGPARPEDRVPALVSPPGSSYSSEAESEIWVTIDLGCGEMERGRAESESPAAEDGGAPGVMMKMKLEPLRRSVSMDSTAPGGASNCGGGRKPTTSGDQASAGKSGRKEGPTEMGRSTSTNSFGVSFLSRLSGRARGPNLPL